MQLVVDVHERRSGVPDALRAMRVSFNEHPLPVGDYVVGDVVIERKTVPDLHGSLLRGRFWGQIGRLRNAGKWRYLIIEGQSSYEGPLRTNAVRGLVLAVNELAVTVLRTATPEDSAGWIAAIAIRVRLVDQRPPRFT